tara:strand:+ start:839 stop:2566 length:1728 start_codon:yes stop_codon:yes gene_type:complete
VAGSNYDVNIKLDTRQIRGQLKQLETRINKLNRLAGRGKANKQALKADRNALAMSKKETRQELKTLKVKQQQLKVDQQQVKLERQKNTIRTTGTQGMAGGPRGGGRSGVLSGALISGAFPLLFGQGLLGGGFGFAGGAIGGLLGGQMGGFAGGLIATAGLTQIQQAIASINDLGAALSKESFNLDKLVVSLGLVGTEEAKRLRLIETLRGKEAALNEVTKEMTRVIGEKGVKDIQEFTTRMQNLTNSLAVFFTRLGAGFAGILNKIASSPLGKAASATNLKLDRLARAENNTDPLMVTLRGKRDALIGSKKGRQATKVKNSPEFKDLNDRVAALQHFFDLQKEITDEEDIQKLTTEAILKNIKGQNLFLQESISLGSFQAEVEQKVRDLKEQQKALNKELSADDEKAFRDQLKLNRTLSETNMLYKNIASTVRTGLVDAIQGAINGTRTLGQVASSVFLQIQRTLLQRGVDTFLPLLPGIGKFFGPRANGGPVKGGKSYLVGERGPEMFTPAVSGAITPNNALGGSNNIVVNVDASGTEVQGDDESSNQLGKLVGLAVQQELINQQRPGGLLSKA